MKSLYFKVTDEDRKFLDETMAKATLISGCKITLADIMRTAIEKIKSQTGSSLVADIVSSQKSKKGDD